ncbi:MAG TPA: transcriptional repressor [Acidobacteriaceae bacterium]
MTQQETSQFRRICEQAGLAVTHQRQVIYEVLAATDGHPSPEEVYARVRRRIPAISLATVYKNIHLFIESGIFDQVSMHHGSMRVETNRAPHYHLVCTGCKSILDMEGGLPGLKEIEERLPRGFRVERLAVDVVGVCEGCQKQVVVQ